MTICIIVAVAENQIMGADGKMPWHLPADLKNFKEMTMGFPLIMGRKTHESIGKALPGRTNIVLTRNPNYGAEGVEIVSSLDAAIALAKQEAVPECFIIGGSNVFREALDRKLVDIIYLTRIHKNLDGDVFFPKLDREKWELVSARRFPIDDVNKLPFTFETYIPTAAA